MNLKITLSGVLVLLIIVISSLVFSPTIQSKNQISFYEIKNLEFLDENRKIKYLKTFYRALPSYFQEVIKTKAQENLNKRIKESRMNNGIIRS